ncbi:MAG: acetoacetate decarboxylase family protein [Sciscionella sp.]
MTELISRTGPRGYTLPLSPSGKAALVAAPPWYFSGEFIWIDYRVDPERAAPFLPPGLTLGPDAGAAAAAFSRWQWCTDQEAELDDPARCQFGEFMLMLAVTHRGRPMARCPYAWVDHAVPLVRGWVQGMPKQLGTVRMTNTVLAGRAGPRSAPGGVYRASLAANDRRIVDGRVTLTERAERPPVLNTVPLVHTRVFPSWDPAGRDVRELVCSQVGDADYSPVWQGTAELMFAMDVIEVDSDLAALLPIEVGSGYVFGYGETLLGGTLIAPPRCGPDEEAPAPELLR